MELKKFLKETGKSTRELADEIGRSQSLVGHFVSGIRRPSPESAIRIERATNGLVTAAELRPDLAEVFGRDRGGAD